MTEQLSLIELQAVEPSTGPARARDLLWDVLDEQFGPVSNDAERGRRNKALTYIRQSVNVEHVSEQTEDMADDLRRRIIRAKRGWSNRVNVTPTSVAANWTMLGSTEQAAALTPAEILALPDELL